MRYNLFSDIFKHSELWHCLDSQQNPPQKPADGAVHPVACHGARFGIKSMVHFVGKAR
jgi:hypothetical protein